MRTIIQMKTLILVVGLLIFLTCNSQAINENPKLVKTQGSTPKANVHRGLLDKKGNLWFGTTGEGIYRYDGKLFHQFTVSDGLSNNNISSILEDKNGNIWFGTDNDLTLFDGKKFTSVFISKTKNGVLSIMQDRNGIIWLGTDDGVYCYDGKSFERFLDKKQIVNNDRLTLKSIESILEDKNGNIWFGSYVSEGISRFDGKFITQIKPNVTLKPFGYVRVMSMLEDRNGNIWFGTADGAYKYDGITLINFAEKEGIDWVYSMLEDKNGNIWFATEKAIGGIYVGGGAWRYDGKSFTNYTTNEGLVHNGVFTIVEDASGKLWFGTRNVGLSMFDGIRFTQFSE
ncbi:ligand-binding sensor domain-containing protein [Flavobacterium wongokense]|uniref:ligand-binding sensor domain-containing protein n=1 Tax=Flavobacterium wongokense TaxID=2910674 RepID=UPI001F1793D0|nr:two-component regulator propeller domain-containing protein [Flavobacterium sp. WG47]MCF6132475.1 hypothetical protein [Flavobacterium sp. WG47]